MDESEGLSENWAEMARDVFEAANNRWTIHDYIRAIKLLQETFGKSYLDRRNVLELMLQHQIVRIADDRLTLGWPDRSSWLPRLLSNGSKAAWELVSEFFPPEAMRKFDAQHLEEIGLEGERWLFGLYSSRLTDSDLDRMKHVSLLDDTLGFDISTPSLKDTSKVIHIEVKTTIKPEKNPCFYLSRNEFEVGLKDPRWVLVMVQKINGKHGVFGHCFASQLEESMPVDSSYNATWESAKVTLSEAMVKPGLP